MKKPTSTAINHALYLLIAADPQRCTSSKEVKDLLRYLGYYVEQREVSDELTRIAKSDNSPIDRCMSKSQSHFYVYYRVDQEPLPIPEKKDTFQFTEHLV